MAKVEFYLNTKANSDGKKGILMYFRYSGKQIVISTNEFINPDNWDKLRKKVKSKDSSNISLNNQLNKIKNDVENTFRECKFQNLSLETADLKNVFKQVMFPEKYISTNKPILTLVEFIDSIINSQLNTKNSQTLKTYKSCKNILIDFQNIKWGKELTFNDIDLDFYLKWVDFMVSKYKHQNNTLNKYTGILKYFMSEALERKLHNNFSFKSSRFNIPREDSDSIYLSDVELHKILFLDLSDKPKLERVRDLFYIGSMTGLRYSALSKLKEDNIDDKFEYFRISKIDKTEVSLQIPIHESVRNILLEYKSKTGESIPKSLSNQKMNDYLKEIGQLAGLDEIIVQTKKIGNKKHSITYHKYELITTHTARRSFATNLYLQGVPVYEIMAMTGHKTEKSFLKYIRITQKEYAKKLKERWDKQ